MPGPFDTKCGGRRPSRDGPDTGDALRECPVLVELSLERLQVGASSGGAWATRPGTRLAEVPPTSRARHLLEGAGGST
jgi:hypothetical protein